eukprot:CAMPEP_0117032610 /NCGR_PEP_ID=MMETSP0472-20121206/23366_1 /TAXON_ID=693140 ORGANISM="Tiarina fusus, Strain LIS" /NCGR_SAMPLE_ID=MMETSP0472 /ASSEMBLY_ACC=CAM_ASM_000603 /LENGTH=355 /DNA_ID=CAMNT_0004741303 /DNA_START=71 /DNA_END=1138 /DNA_ORIENTATION=+
MTNEIVRMKLPFSSFSTNAVDASILVPLCNNSNDEHMDLIPLLNEEVESYLDSALDILDCVETLLQDDDDDDDDDDQDQMLEPTPINTDSARVRVVSQLSVQDDPSLGFNEAIASDLINVLLLRKEEPPSNKRSSRDLPCSVASCSALQPPPSKRPRTVIAVEEDVVCSSSVSGQAMAPCASSTLDEKSHRFRAYQSEQWWDRFQDMLDFKRDHDHCCVPNTYAANPHLAQWVKRQRYQYKLKHEGKHSTLTDEREATLQEMGFIWDSHGAAWLERWNELAKFRAAKGHSNVPTNYSENKPLAIWVKCQRRQYKLYSSGSRSNMTQERINKLESVGFVWHPRGGAYKDPATIFAR